MDATWAIQEALLADGSMIFYHSLMSMYLASLVEGEGGEEGVLRHGRLLLHLGTHVVILTYTNTNTQNRRTVRLARVEAIHRIRLGHVEKALRLFEPPAGSGYDDHHHVDLPKYTPIYLNIHVCICTYLLERDGCAFDVVVDLGEELLG